MRKRVIISGLLGAVILIVWTFLVNGILGFGSSIDRKSISAERQVHEFLKASLSEPGRYIANPELTLAGTFPEGEPVFSIHYSGMGHDSAGTVMLVQLAMFVITPMIGAWMLSVSSPRILSSYPRRVLFFAALGLLIALYGGITNFAIDGYGAGDALMLALLDIITWTLVGMVVAWRMQPEPGILGQPQRVRA
jgi:hypothetical protein